MCCAEFIAKYVLIIANSIFSILGIVIVGLGIVVAVNLGDLQEILPVSLLYITIIVLGCIVFLIGWLACCGAIRESRCMLICYAIIVSIILALCIYLTVVIFGHLDNIQQTVNGWIVSAFNALDLRPAFNVMESTFRCCGTTGPNSYGNQTLPASCCSSEVQSCISAIAHQGCNELVGSWFESIGSAIGSVMIVVIIIEAVAVILALFVSHSIRNKMRRAY